MNVSPGAMAPKLRTILVLVAAVAALTATAVSTTAPAGASSGGTSVTGSDSSGSGGKYKRLWRKTSRHNKRWARHTAECESGKDPDAIGGGGKYRGAFQFMKPTWRQAPKSPGGDPIKYGFRTQAVVAVALKKREGTSAWPVCG